MQHLKFFRICRIAARHPEIAKNKLREKCQIETDKNDDGRKPRKPFGIHFSTDFRPPVMHASQECHYRSAHHDVVKVGDHEVSIGDVNVEPQSAQTINPVMPPIVNRPMNPIAYSMGVSHGYGPFDTWSRSS